MSNPNCGCVNGTAFCRSHAMQLKQRSREWFQARCGKVTSSRVFHIVDVLKKGGPTAERAKYFRQLVAERLTGKAQDMRRIRSMDDRSDMEPDARSAYGFYFDREVVEVGFIQHPVIQMAGASPDGLVGADGMIEIKCLDASNHIDLLEGNEEAIERVMLQYLPQVHFGMACAERAWCDFVSFCPQMQDEELRLFSRTVHRDDHVIGMLEEAVNEFLGEVSNKVALVRRRLEPIPTIALVPETASQGHGKRGSRIPEARIEA